MESKTVDLTELETRIGITRGWARQDGSTQFQLDRAASSGIVVHTGIRVHWMHENS